ncbi:hypothetical protein R3P38DRAFT_2526628 [Favolaschia claudopus]|uniref:Nephrocystin 3-like N-terminal domain-containing protein n=1 Tax=Favolaschia claudopus TaxID=2862362 RepID=A0AAW0BLD1_9AGAR
MRTLYEWGAHQASNDSDSGDSHAPLPRHPDIRLECLSNLRTWSCHETSNILWMFGAAGCGKSTIARWFCQELATVGRLGGSFFFKRGHPSRGSAMRLFPTLAYQLAHAFPQLEASIADTIHSDPSIVAESLAFQLHKLIIEPYQVLANPPRPIVIVIDGLDECSGEENQEEILRCISMVPPSLHILVISRPKRHIRAVFRKAVLSHARYLSVEGHSVDIQTYFGNWHFQRKPGPPFPGIGRMTTRRS